MNAYEGPEQWAQGLLISAVFGGIWYLLPLAPLPLLLALLPVAAWVVFRQPFLVCLLFVLFSFFRIHEAVPALLNFKIPQLLALGALAGLGWTWVTGGMKTWLTPELKIFLAFSVVVLGSVLGSSLRPSSMEYFTSVYSKIILMTFVIAWLATSRLHFKLAITGVLLSGLLVAKVAISNKLAGIGLVEETRVTIGRDISSVLGDPNDLAVVLLFPLSFALALAATRRSPWFLRLLGILSAGLICWAILATQSRGGMLGVLAVCGVLGWQRVKNKVLLVAVSAVLASVLYAASGIGDRATVQRGEGDVDLSAQGRLNAWEAAVSMAVDHPLTGVGLNMYLGNYYLYTPHWDGRAHAVHSSWFGVLGETGFIGLLLFIALNLTVTKRAWKMDSGLRQTEGIPLSVLLMSQALLAGLVGNMVSGTFLTHAFLWPFYILLALTIALYRYVETNHPIALEKSMGVESNSAKLATRAKT
ncbi:MAG: O-antigen ligase family protein [Oceanococcus sp.]